MIASLTHYEYCRQLLWNDSSWKDCYPSLRSLALNFVFSLRIPDWRGQEADVAEDIVQETALRLLKYSQKVERGEVIPISSPERFMAIVAHNYCRDLRRRDQRLVRTTSCCGLSSQGAPVSKEETHLLEVAVENAYQEQLFTSVAEEIAKFPDKQRRALLIDLANRMHFDTAPTPLQIAFLKVGIQLQDYQLPLPSNPVERAQHSSLLSLAYKRISTLFRTQMRHIAA